MKTKKSVVGKILIYLFLILLALLFLVPVFYVMYNSLLPKRYIGSFVMPSLWSLDNYKELFSEFPIMKWYGNTAISTVAVVLGNIFFTPLAGYGLAKLRFPGRKVIFICLMLSMMIPGQLVLLPQYIMMAKMGLVNTLLAIILPYLSQSMFIFMSRQFFYGIPEELEEAARIDGAGPWRFFVDVVLPLSRTNTAALFVVLFIYGWNQYLWPLLVTNQESMYTIVMGIQRMVNIPDAVPEWNLIMAVALLGMLPPLLVVLGMQKLFVRGLVETEK